MNTNSTRPVGVGLLACLALSTLAVFGDTLILKNGNSVSGTVIKTNGDDILLMADYGTFTFSRSNMKEIRVDPRKAAEPTRTNRIPDFKALVAALSKQDWASDLRQIPATVIDKGMLKNVPYTSFRCGQDYEVNVYGDLDHPAGIEAGVYRKLLDDASAKGNCLQFIAGLLGRATDRAIIEGLNQQQDLKKLDELTFEITPPTAEDAYMGWWISVYSEKQLNSARASERELAGITTPKVAGNQADDPSAWNTDDLKLARGSPKSLITFTSNSGEVIKNAQVISVRDGVSLMWRKDGSGGVVRLADLSEDLRTRFGYDPAKTKAADEQDAQKKTQDWQRAQASATASAQATAGSTLYSKASDSSGTSAAYDGGSTFGSGPSGRSSNSSSGGSVYVRGYTRSNGTYVHSYTRSAPGGGRR